MSITLDSTLQAAQNGQTHHIIADIKTKAIISDIPFTGEYLTEETLNEIKSNCLSHSSNRICGIYKFNTAYFKYFYTDTDRQEFTIVTLHVITDLESAGQTLEATLTELSDGTIGMIYTTLHTTNIYIRWAKLSVTGTVLDTGLIDTKSTTTVSEVVSPDIVCLADDSFLLVYSEGTLVEPVSGGTYTGSTASTYHVEITQEGTETTAFFKYRKDSGSWSAEIQCDGTNQTLAEGVTIRFVAATYYVGMRFQIYVTPATKAGAYISLTENPDPLDTVSIGGVTYTLKTYPLVGGGNPNDVAIDIQAYEITLQNLSCALNDENYEGMGEGDRYGTGTTANPLVDSTRSGYILTVQALTAGAAGNSIVVTVSSPFSASSMSGGADSAIGDVVASTSSVIRKRTGSVDFETWGVEGTITIANIGAVEKQNLSISLMQSGDLWLLLDNYDDLFYANSYYSVSADNGLSWGAATALTSYTSAIASGKHPELVQKTSTTAHVVYHEERGALHVTDESPSWPGGMCSPTSINVYSDKVYFVNTNAGFGVDYLASVIEVDIATWRITRSWTTSSTPAFHTFFGNIGCPYNSMQHEDEYIAVTGNQILSAVLNVDTNQIRHFFWKDWPAQGILKNVDWEPSDIRFIGLPMTDRLIHFVTVYSDTLYVVMSGGHPYKKGIEIVSVDLTQTEVPGQDWITSTVYADAVGDDPQVFNQFDVAGFGDGDFRVYEDVAILTSKNSSVSGWRGRVDIFDKTTSTWTLLKTYEGDDVDMDLPYFGIGRVAYDGINIYGVFDTVAPHDLGLKRGICKINTNSDLITFIEPVLPFQTDNYYLNDIILTEDNKIILSSLAYGVILYNIGSAEWTLYSNDTLTGLTPTGEDNFIIVNYDADNDMLFGGYGFEGLAGFSEYGYLRHPYYAIGTLTDSWNFAAAEDFAAGYLESDCSITLDPVDNGIFAFWTHQDEDERSIKWDKETPEFNIMPYIVRSDPIIIRRSIKTNTPNSISFSVAYGHLFDPFNAASIWRNYIKKGYKIIVRYGELINNIEYWQNMGTFVITERSVVTYQRGKYPIIEIKGEDKRHIWKDMDILVGTDYTVAGATPKYILDHLLEDDVGELPADIDVPTFANTTTLYNQWVETTVLEIIEQIMGRYGYFAKITVDDDFTCKRISDQNDIDHVYYNADQIITYTPDDTFSDYTNKIIVTCEGREYYQNIKYEDTVIQTVTGTLGWWGQKETKTIWFCNEHKKQFIPLSETNINYSLRVLESAEANMMFRLAGSIKEEITEWAEDNTYCILKVEAPDLRIALASAIALYIAALQSDSLSGRIAQAGLFAVIMYILGSVTTYRYEIHGYPVGYDRRSWQAIATDDDLITEVGKEIIKEIEEPLAYYIDEAQVVADYEMLITRLQRRRLKITKTAHMQDEEGDTITFTHPHSGRTMNMFVTDITRILKLPEDPNGSGGFEDQIEGWIL